MQQQGAEYVAVARLDNGDGAMFDRFATAVAVDGDMAVAGAYVEDTLAGADAGAAHWYRRVAGGWVHGGRLVAPDAEIEDRFGIAVDISGDWMAIGAFWDVVNGNVDQGSAYLFRRQGDDWVFDTKLTDITGNPGDYFGFALALDGDTLAIGARGDSDISLEQGAVHIFVRQGAGWAAQARIDPPTVNGLGYFGASVAVDGDRMLVGAPGMTIEPGPVAAGAAYVYERTGTAWQLAGVLQAPQPASNAAYGFAVASDRERLLVGAFQDGVQARGAAYVHRADTLALDGELRATLGQPGELAGISVALAGPRAYLGASGFDRNGANGSGRVLETIDLGGRSVIPGLTDSHIHLIDTGLTMRQAALETCCSPAEVIDQVRRTPASDGDWLVGVGFQVNRFPPSERPHRSLLDAAFPDRPVLLHSRCLHQVWVNTAALRRAGVTASTPDPAGGHIVRDENGEPTGVLQEEAVGLVTRAVPEPTGTELQRAAREAAGNLWSHGVVAVHAPEPRRYLEALMAMDRGGELAMRVFFLPPFGVAEELVGAGIIGGFGHEWLRLGALKLFLDGALGSATALMHTPYEDNPANRGIEVIPAERFAEMVEFAHTHRWRLAVHAIGDKAVDRAVETLGASQRARGDRREDPGIWDRIEHFQVCSPGAAQRAAQTRTAAMMQPIHLFDDWRAAGRLWGSERSARAYACRSLLDAGVPVCFGSDAPVASTNPFECIHAAVERTDLAGQTPA